MKFAGQEQAAGLQDAGDLDKQRRNVGYVLQDQGFEYYFHAGVGERERRAQIVALQLHGRILETLTCDGEHAFGKIEAHHVTRVLRNVLRVQTRSAPDFKDPPAGETWGPHTHHVHGRVARRVWDCVIGPSPAIVAFRYRDLL